MSLVERREPMTAAYDRDMTIELDLTGDPVRVTDPAPVGPQVAGGGPDPPGPGTADAPVIDANERWVLLKALFVDSPLDATAAADELVADAIASLTRRLDRWRADVADRWVHDQADTETLRTAMLRYREVLDHLEAIQAVGVPPPQPTERPPSGG